MRKGEVYCRACKGKADFKFSIDIRSIYICTVCRLRFTEPQPNDQQLAQSYEELYFGVSESTHFTDEFVLRQIVQRYVLPQIENCMSNPTLRDKKIAIVDFGSGSSKLVRIMRSLGLESFGVEPYAKSTEGGVVFNSLEELKSALPPNYVIGGIILNEVVEHLRTPHDTLKALFLSLPVGGFMFIGTPNFKCLRALIFGRFFSQYRNPTHLYFFEESTLRTVIRAGTGAEAVRLKSYIDFGPSTYARRLLRKMLQRLSLDGSLRMVVRKISH